MSSESYHYFYTTFVGSLMWNEGCLHRILYVIQIGVIGIKINENIISIERLIVDEMQNQKWP